MTPKQVEKVLILRAKIEAGIAVKDSEWPTWLRGAPKVIWKASEDTRSSHEMTRLYLDAMGFTDESEANPAAISWNVYHARERGESCDVCGRSGLERCDPCRDWVYAQERHKASAYRAA
jgi:hypothetical protein